MNERTFVSSSGAVLAVRPMTSADDELVVTAFEHLSPSTIRRRFFDTTLLRLGHDRMAQIVALRPGHHVLLAFDHRGDLVGGARVIPDPARAGAAEVAVTVGDHWQGQGIGHHLMRLAAEAAAGLGIERLVGHVLADNGAARSLVAGAGGYWWVDEPGVLAFEIVLRPTIATLDAAIARSLQSAS